MNLKDPTGKPLGAVFSHLTFWFLPAWLVLHVIAFFSPTWFHHAFQVPPALDQVALPILAAYGLTRKQQNGALAQTLAALMEQPATPTDEPKG